jgi:hypothetical protein
LCFQIALHSHLILPSLPYSDVMFAPLALSRVRASRVSSAPESGRYTQICSHSRFATLSSCVEVAEAPLFVRVSCAESLMRLHRYGANLIRSRDTTLTRRYWRYAEPGCNCSLVAMP